jgi:hypothetical protein
MRGLLQVVVLVLVMVWVPAIMLVLLLALGAAWRLCKAENSFVCGVMFEWDLGAACIQSCAPTKRECFEESLEKVTSITLSCKLIFCNNEP